MIDVTIKTIGNKADKHQYHTQLLSDGQPFE